MAYAQNEKKPAYTADRHVALGMKCSDCHGEGAKKPVSGDKCLSCHESIDAVAKQTNGVLDPNPHAGHVGDLDCTLCHHGHKANELYCNTCHSNMVVKRSAAPAKAGAATK
jgi:fumarate reductase flavoprotein subunit